jgi:glycosyltransferase involved in cell wall biosynthesis
MISIVIPIYNEEEVLPRLHAAIHSVMDTLGETWEVVYVNDGSRDRSLEMLLQMRQRDPHVVVVELSRNWGHQPALTAGMTHASGDAVVLMDGDMQDPTSAIIDMVAEWRKGAQVVIAERKSRAERGLRGLLFRLFYRVLGALSDFPIPLNAGIFGLLDRQAVDAILQMSETNRYLPGLRSWVGYKTATVYYDRAERAAGEPKQSFWKLLRYGLDAIFSFSYKPLRLSLTFGSVIALFSMLYGFFLVGCRIFGVGLFGIPVVDGYTTTIVAILFLGGVQLMSVGILGEYIGRIYDEVKRRPLFFVRQVHEGRLPHEHRGIHEAEPDRVSALVLSGQTGDREALDPAASALASR